MDDLPSSREVHWRLEPGTEAVDTFAAALDAKELDARADADVAASSALWSAFWQLGFESSLLVEGVAAGLVVKRLHQIRWVGTSTRVHITVAMLTQWLARKAHMRASGYFQMQETNVLAVGLTFLKRP